VLSGRRAQCQHCVGSVGGTSAKPDGGAEDAGALVNHWSAFFARTAGVKTTRGNVTPLAAPFAGLLADELAEVF